MKSGFDTLALGAIFGQSSKVVVIGAATVVVLAIVVVFIMVLRSDSGGDKKTARGLASDFDEGPAGPSFGGRNRDRSAPADADWGAPVGGRGGFGPDAAHRPSDFGGTVGSAGAGGFKSGTSRPQPQQPAWGRGSAAWNDDAPPAGPGAGWGKPPAPEPAWGDQQPGWGAQQRPSSRPAGGPLPAAAGPAADGWGQPISQPAGNRPPTTPPPQTGWPEPPQPAWGDQQAGGWGAPPAGPGPRQSSAPAWDQPQQPAWGNQPDGWGAPPPAGDQPAAWQRAAEAPAGPPPQAPGWGAPAGGDPASASPGAGWRGGPAPQGPQTPPQPAWGAEPAGAAPGAGWRSGPAPDQAPAGPAVRTDSRTAYIIIREGKEPGRTFELRKERMSIGRSRESEIFLEDLAVSRLHASIYRDDQGSYILRDENSANGTTVNGQRVSEHRLVEGDEIQVGQTIMTFTRR